MGKDDLQYDHQPGNESITGGAINKGKYMNRDKKSISLSGSIMLLLVLANIIVGTRWFISDVWKWGFAITLPLLVLAISDVLQISNARRRKYPLIWRLHLLFRKMKAGDAAKQLTVFSIKQNSDTMQSNKTAQQNNRSENFKTNEHERNNQ